MKNYICTKGAGFIVMHALIFSVSACTKNFEKYNTNENGITDAQLIPDNNSIGAFYPSVQYAIGTNDPSGRYTFAGSFEYLNVGAFSGYVMCPLPGSLDYNYNLTPAWESYSLFNHGYSAVMSQVNNIKRVGGAGIDPDFWAIAKILQVAQMHKITDCYGPIPYSKFGSGGSEVPYDKQEDIYNTFFLELDTAVNSLQAFIAAKPTATPFQKFDVTSYNGSYPKWLKYANSLRLRLALHIVKADPVRAKLEAEKALDPVNGGVITNNSDNATVPKGRSALWNVDHGWANLNAGAALVTYMRGYNDPRLPVFFEPSVISPGQYVGIRAGSYIDNYQKMLEFSHTSGTTFSQTTTAYLLSAAEVYFLRAEGVLRGWNMGAQTARELYEQGILSSLQQWNVAGNAGAYIENETGKPENFIDPYNDINSSPALSSITIKWDEAASNEVKLEKIITQKWISLFPDATEAWTNYRRTGYPKLFPVVVNNSSGTISTEIQIRRLKFLQTEYSTNSMEVQKAVTALGGPDTGGTRLWWDIAGPNF